nr:hypothetical protein [Tanacetum cinerariifolium]
MQTSEEKVDTSKALDASLFDIESNGTESKEQDTSSRLRNDAHNDDAHIRPIYDEEPMAEVQTTAKINIFATGQQYTEQLKFNNEGEVKENKEKDKNQNKTGQKTGSVEKPDSVEGQSQSRKKKKRRNTSSRDQYRRILKVVLCERKQQGLNMQFMQSNTTRGETAIWGK